MRIGIFAGVFAGMCWGTIFLFPAVLKDFSPLSIACMRYVSYGIISFLVFLPNAKSLLNRLTVRHLLILVKLVFTGNILYYIFTSQAIQLIGVAPTALMLGLVPVTAVLFGANNANGISVKTLAGPLLLIITGMICLNTDVFVELAQVTVGKKIVGILCALTALMLWSWFAIDNAKFLKSDKVFSGNEWTLLYGTATGAAMFVILPFILMFTELIPADIAPERLYIFIISGLILAVIPSFLGNIAWNVASVKLPISLVGQMIVFETIFALIYGFIYEGRFPRGLEIAAMIFLISGVLWSVRKHR